MQNDNIPFVTRTCSGGARFGSDLRARLTEPLQAAVEKGDDIMLIAHSLGTMISYDVLWKFSHYYEYRKLRENGRAPMINTFLTLGTPLGNKTVKECVAHPMCLVHN